MMQHSKKRIVLSSLYLGTGELERSLVDSIESNLATNPNLSVKVLLDYSRGLRGQSNSRTLMQHLISKHPSQMSLHLYHTPKLRGLSKRYMPERLNESIGVLHMKIYIADDTLIISGLSFFLFRIFL